MHPALEHIAHRPWPLPSTPWRWRQSWLDLAFLHYRVPDSVLRSRIPGALEIDRHDNTAWVSVVPFRMADFMRGNLPCPPPFRSFPELNVRTYVRRDGKPGVWFFSLDADCWPLVVGARLRFGLPYFKATMHLERCGDGYRLRSERRAGSVNFAARYRPVGPVFQARPGSFEHWVAERYCLYTVRGADLLRLEVHHAPWPLQMAEIEVEHSDLLRAAGLEALDPTPVVHFTTGVGVVTFDAERVDAVGARTGA